MIAYKFEEVRCPLFPAPGQGHGPTHQGVPPAPLTPVSQGFPALVHLVTGQRPLLLDLPSFPKGGSWAPPTWPGLCPLWSGRPTLRCGQIKGHRHGGKAASWHTRMRVHLRLALL